MGPAFYEFRRKTIHFVQWRFIAKGAILGVTIPATEAVAVAFKLNEFKSRAW